jgi:hypothetical protein
VLRRPQIQADNVGRFVFELRIVAGQVTLQAVGFETGFLPDPMHSVLADTQRCRQFAATPMGGTVVGFLARGRQNPGPQSGSQNRGLLAGMIRVEPVEPGFEEALLQRMIVGALVCSLRLMLLKEAPSASIKMSLARKT